ncbi:MAG: YcxB family protein [Ruminococcaceae bacterium]|nr:YcxB family protein [Oscillospiraceae bacterium]
METFSISVLLTKDEYCSSAAHRLPSLGWGIPIGLFLMLCGVTVWLLELGASLTWGFLVIGVTAALFDSVILPVLVRGVMGARFDRTRHEAWHLTFSGESVTVKSGRVSGTFPYTLLTYAEETVHYFNLDFGAELSLCVPRRALAPWQITALQRLIAV